MVALVVPTLKTSRMELSPLSERDGPSMFELWASPQVCQHSGPAVDYRGVSIPLPARQRQDSDRLLDYWLKRRAEGTGFRWAVRLGADRTFVGAVGFNELGELPELAYHLLPERWGHGIMQEAAREALAWCFSSSEAVAVVAFVEPDNERSASLARRLGFSRDGEDDSGAHRYVMSASRWRADTLKA